MLEAIRSRMISDWQWVLKNSWSVRLILLAAVLSGAEVVLPLFSASFAPGAFALMSFFVTVGAFVARMAAQSRDE